MNDTFFTTAEESVPIEDTTEDTTGGNAMSNDRVLEAVNKMDALLNKVVQFIITMRKTLGATLCSFKLKNIGSFSHFERRLNDLEHSVEGVGYDKGKKIQEISPIASLVALAELIELEM
ncbi:unnamed protein product [Haemonchus placei]|uniref:Transcriptional regulator n=1 Tax=Haemonchus placei TaxID=6290 RepID=A0A0N4WA31_HAEPC|nr:unnamed protein product [Haemonchus placei]